MRSSDEGSALTRAAQKGQELLDPPQSISTLRSGTVCASGDGARGWVGTLRRVVPYANRISW